MATRITLTAQGWIEATRVDLDRHVYDEAQRPHVRVYESVAELRATCPTGRCTMHRGHRTAHYDGIQGREILAEACPLGCKELAS
jgi:hypothetical protein